MYRRDHLDGLLSPFLRRRRLQAAQGFVRGRVLDYGCGIGLAGAMLGVTAYVGVDTDEEALAVAVANNPTGRFYRPDQLSAIDGEIFDTVSALAVIEHLPDPVSFLTQMAGFLAENGRIVLTTPNPALDGAHGFGASLGLFDRTSRDQHQSLMGRRRLAEVAAASSLRVSLYQRFLAGANQLAVLER